MILLNGLPDDRISISDRGLQYGDGLFETMVYRAGTIEFLDEHLARMLLGCKRLNIVFEQLEQLKHELNQICEYLAAASEHRAIIKIIITRGSGGRGYLAATGIEPTRIISTHPFPQYPTENSNSGVNIRRCSHALSENVTLAGIKHLNRLDQVLARNEWSSPDIFEGLMLNSAGDIIEGTMSNVFIVKEGLLMTPKLDKAGVAGIMRSQVLLVAEKLSIAVKECILSYNDVLCADEVFITNSVIGLWPVKKIDATSLNIGPLTQRLKDALQRVRN